ncbi:hypothetical protein BSU75_05340, partial [Salmonella enterica subsp. enterica serovar Enteritidis]
PPPPPPPAPPPPPPPFFFITQTSASALAQCRGGAELCISHRVNPPLTAIFDTKSIDYNVILVLSCIKYCIKKLV